MGKDVKTATKMLAKFVQNGTSASDTDVQIETGSMAPDTIGAAAENWGRNSVSKNWG